MSSASMKVNGNAVTGDLEGRPLLVQCLREHLGLKVCTQGATLPSAAPVQFTWMPTP